MEELRRAGRLLELGLDSTDPTKGGGVDDQIGDYVLRGEIGRGSTCVVYRATHTPRDGDQTNHADVALKIMNAVDRTTDAREAKAAKDYFRHGALAAQILDHKNIVRVIDVGEHDGRPFFTMELVEGGTLQQHVERHPRPEPVDAARMLAKVARAVHYAHTHERGVIHRDLKPANILVDEQDEPYVTDFGLARRIDHRASVADQSNVVGYTVEYMSPEQAKLDAHKLTFATDVYSLGVIFYELLTGRGPYGGPTPFALFQQLSDARPVRPPREIEPALDRDFEDICLKCLDKDPQRRYQSAKDLAEDLERAGKRDRPRAHRSARARAINSIRRQPRRSTAVSYAALLVLALELVALFDWRARERERRDVLGTNAFIAGSQAGAVLAQFREDADRVADLARDPVLQALLVQCRMSGSAPMLGPLTKDFDSLFVMTNDARILAQWPAGAPFVYSRTYLFRDYFRGARELAETRLVSDSDTRSGAYVARAFQSESHGRLEFAFSAPVLDSRGAFLGLVVATLSANSAFGAVRMEDLTESGKITTALIGPRGNDRSDEPHPPPRSDFTFLVHPRLGLGAEYPLARPSPTTLREAFGAAADPGEQFRFRYVPPIKVADFRDPVPGFEGKWLAAFAPVGRTGFVVLVERPQEVAQWTRLLPDRLASARGISLALGLLVLSAAAVCWLVLHTTAIVIGRQRGGT